MSLLNCNGRNISDRKCIRMRKVRQQHCCCMQYQLRYLNDILVCAVRLSDFGLIFFFTNTATRFRHVITIALIRIEIHIHQTSEEKTFINVSEQLGNSNTIFYYSLLPNTQMFLFILE